MRLTGSPPIFFFISGLISVGKAQHGLLWHDGHGRPGVGGGDVDRHAHRDREDLRWSSGELLALTMSPFYIHHVLVMVLVQLVPTWAICSIPGGACGVVALGVVYVFSRCRCALGRG